MTRQMEAVLMIAKHQVLKGILLPVIDTGREKIHWDRISYGVLSGGEKAAISWAWCVWTDEQVPGPGKWEEYPGYPMRDPFDSFGVMGRDLQAVVLRALAHRWGG